VLASEAAILSLGAGMASALAAVPVAARIAQRTGFLDRPVGYKKHASPTPYLGGSAGVLASGIAAIAVLEKRMARLKAKASGRAGRLAAEAK
jgi:UDP-N-acetylmuramyl pentapeptide phosphotransferase/UDP-N-acetylglucosamine-1-phosphate transferase